MDSETSDDCSDCSSIGNNIQQLVFSPLPESKLSEWISFDIFTAASVGDILDVGREIDVNVSNSGGWTALMYASYYGHPTAVELLVDSGSHPETRNLNGRTALILASMCGNDEVVSILLNRGAGLESRDNKEWNALFHATHLGHHSTVQVLLQWGSNPNARDSDGFTPIIIAAMEGHELIMQHLLQHGGDVLAKTAAGDTSRHLANINGYTKVVSLIDSHLLSKHFDRAMPNLQEGPAILEKLITRQSGQTKVHEYSERRKTSLPTDTLGWCEGAKINRQPTDLLSFLASIGLTKYYNTFEKQDVDLQVFLTLTDNDLKEIGISLLGPRRKMTSAIARWHSCAPILSALEQVYADKLEAEMQEMGVQLHRALSQIEVVEKQCDHERQLRAIVESCLTQEKTFICDLLKLCRSLETTVGILSSKSAIVCQYLVANSSSSVTHVQPIKGSIKTMCLQVDGLVPVFKEVVARATSRLRFINQQAARV